MGLNLKKRVDKLAARALPTEVWVMAQAEDGTEREVTIDEWYDRRHELRFMRFTRGYDPTFHDINLLIASMYEECGMPEEAKRWEEK